MNCAPLLADLFLYSYESEFLDSMIRGGHRKLATTPDKNLEKKVYVTVFSLLFPSKLTTANTFTPLARYNVVHVNYF